MTEELEDPFTGEHREECPFFEPGSHAECRKDTYNYRKTALKHLRVCCDIGFDEINAASWEK